MTEETREQFNKIIFDICDNTYIAGKYAEAEGQDCKSDREHQEVALTHINKLSELVDNAIQEERNRLVEEILSIRQQVRKNTGAFKYDFAFDEIINLIKPSN